MSLLPGVVKYNKRGNKMGCYGINGEGKGLKSFFFSFVSVWVLFRIWGERRNGGLAHSENTHCRAFGSLFDRVAWDTEQWIELIRFTIFAQRRREGRRNSEHSGCPSIPQL